jgi:hypothetical protein
MAYSPHEPKKAVLRGFPVVAELYRKEKEPEKGLFALKIQTLLFPLSSKGGINGGESTHLPCCSFPILSLTCCPERKTIGIPPPVFTLPLKKERFLYFSRIWGALKPVFFLLYETISGA